MAEHTPGTMDITEQKRTFHGFVVWTMRTVYICIAVLIFLALFVA